MKSIAIAAAALLATAALAGCATSGGPADYSYRETRGVESVSYGRVESVRPVRLNEDHAPVGTIAGAAIGGIAGSTLGHGAGGAVATILGAVGGGLAGNAIEHSATAQNGEEIIVRLDNGQTIAVVQGGFQDFAAGQRVRVLSGSQRTRVEHA
jgi:outer membrane lipoprotein SlyB